MREMMTLRRAIKDDDLPSVRRRLVRCDVTYRDMSLAVSRNHPHIVKAVMKKFAVSSIESRIVEYTYSEKTNIVRRECAPFNKHKKEIQCNMCYVINMALTLGRPYSLALALEIHARSVGTSVKKCAPDDWFPNVSFGEGCHIAKYGMERYTTILQSSVDMWYAPETGGECIKVLLEYGANPLFIFADVDDDILKGYNMLVVKAFGHAQEVLCSHILERCIAISLEFTRDQIGRHLLVWAFRRGFVSLFERILFLGVNVDKPQRFKNVSYSIGGSTIKTDSHGNLEYVGNYGFYSNGKWCGNYFFHLIYPLIHIAVRYVSMWDSFQRKVRMLDLLMYSGMNPSSCYSQLHSPIEYLTLGYSIPYGHDDLPPNKNRDFLLDRFKTFHQHLSLRVMALTRIRMIQ
jgi:hypothetical protein